MLKIALLLVFSLSLFAQSNSWYSRVDAKIEAGLYLPQLSGSIENVKGTSDFSQDLGYDKAEASYFSLELRHNYDYIPNVYISYFNMQDDKSTALDSDANATKSVTVANETFNSGIFSTIDYQVFNTTLYQDFRIKGKAFTLFGTHPYSGDLEFDVGLSVKYFQWKYEIKDLSNLSRATSWINVDEFVPVPYIGMKYFRYKLLLYANANALAFSKAKSSAYQVGIGYRVVSGLYLDASYVYERFKAVEKQDTVDFKTTGLKFGFKYAF